jgi:hypothetical protein
LLKTIGFNKILLELRKVIFIVNILIYLCYINTSL